ncbi:MAG: hypothetical protein HQM11_07730 [SAR324 cluster bacterium]|nr:hypothetical protein [SAR324 cluster bacterium]
MNQIDAYNPTFYAQEALMILYKSLGMANRVYRGYDKATGQKGKTIQIRKPGSFDVNEGGSGTIQDLETDMIDVTLDQWKEVKFGLTDLELSYTTDQVIQEHIAPAAYALANYIDSALMGRYIDVPWQIDGQASPDEQDVVNCRKVLVDNAGALIDAQTNMVHFAIDSFLEAAYLPQSWMSNASVSGNGQNLDALLRGTLAQRFGVQLFRNQNIKQHTSGTVISGTNTGALVGAATKGASSIAVDGFAVGGETLKAGDSFVIAGNSQRYVVTSNVTLTGGAGTIGIFPNLVQNHLDNAVVTFDPGASTNADSFYANMMFHRNAFALAMAPLPEIGDGAGARMSVITDPQTNLSIRSRLSYNDSSAKVVVTLDVLFGTKCVEPNLACLLRRDV